MIDKQFGEIKCVLTDTIMRKGISKNKVASRAEMQRSQLNNYCNGKVQRFDAAVLFRLCYALDCDLSDILEYIPPQNET